MKTRILTIMVIAIALLGTSCLSADAATTTGPIAVNAGVGSTLEIAAAIMPKGTATSTTALDFGALTADGAYIRSTGWYEVGVWVTTNAPTWTVNSKATALTSGADTLPVGSLIVNGPSTGADVDANTNLDIDVANNSNSGVGSQITVVYAMPTNKTPNTQPVGNYAGTVTLTVVAA